MILPFTLHHFVFFLFVHREVLFCWSGICISKLFLIGIGNYSIWRRKRIYCGKCSLLNITIKNGMLGRNGWNEREERAPNVWQSFPLCWRDSIAPALPRIGGQTSPEILQTSYR
jgi:hypothetical protein